MCPANLVLHMDDSRCLHCCNVSDPTDARECCDCQDTTGKKRGRSACGGRACLREADQSTRERRMGDSRESIWLPFYLVSAMCLLCLKLSVHHLIKEDVINPILQMRRLGSKGLLVCPSLHQCQEAHLELEYGSFGLQNLNSFHYCAAFNIRAQVVLGFHLYKFTIFLFYSFLLRKNEKNQLSRKLIPILY